MNRMFDMIQPTGVTPIGGKLEELLLTYLDKIEKAKAREIAGESKDATAIKPVNYIVLTDGAPSQCQFTFIDGIFSKNIITADDPEDVIVMAARRLDRGNFPITQVDTPIFDEWKYVADRVHVQVGIQFVQIGNSILAAEFLQELDDGLTSNHGIRVSQAAFRRTKRS